jgi:SOUL heme-binding protein
MTAPVIQQGKRDGGEVIWSVRFIMPQKWTMDTLPKPKDTRVKLIPVAAKQQAVIRFSGTASDALIAEKTEDLRKYVTDNKISVVGQPILAFYNPPWTLPILRRNEIMLELAAPPARNP